MELAAELLFPDCSGLRSGQDLHRIRSLIRSAHRAAGRSARRQFPVRWQHDRPVRTGHLEAEQEDDIDLWPALGRLWESLSAEGNCLFELLLWSRPIHYRSGGERIREAGL